MRFLCLQHVPFEGPAALADWARTRGHGIDCHALYESANLPPLDEYDGLMVLGGPMNLYEELEHPWLAAEKNFIRSALDAGHTIIGICLGAQLIADALGTSVRPGPAPEIGWFPIQREDGCPRGFPLPDELSVLHWHGDQFDLPEGTQPIAQTGVCPVQGFTDGTHILALQCHLEATPESVAALVSNCEAEIALEHMDIPLRDGRFTIVLEPDSLNLRNGFVSSDTASGRSEVKFFANLDEERLRVDAMVDSRLEFLSRVLVKDLPDVVMRGDLLADAWAEI